MLHLDEGWADSTGDPQAGMVLQRCPKLGEGTWSLHPWATKTWMWALPEMRDCGGLKTCP